MSNSWKYGYAGPVDDVTGHPVGCECWTCYLGRVRIGDGWVATEPRAGRAAIEQPRKVVIASTYEPERQDSWVRRFFADPQNDWLGPDAAGSTGL